jgi:hypothetical protein
MSGKSSLAFQLKGSASESLASLWKTPEQVPAK